jgi:hypothetical protein
MSARHYGTRFRGWEDFLRKICGTFHLIHRQNCFFNASGFGASTRAAISSHV